MPLARDPVLTQEDLKTLLNYSPDTGIFTWINYMGPWARAGDTAGCLHDCRGKKYVRIKIRGRHSMAHRLAWLYMTGNWPPKEIDHHNGNSTDNRWCNLRTATRAQNSQNKLGGKSGFKGVQWRRNRWESTITANGRRIHIGSFRTPEEAHAAYCAAAAKHHGEFARTS